MQPSVPMTMPKQWYSGTGMHTRSAHGGRQLSQDPLGAIRRPDAQSVAWLEPEAHQPEDDRIDPSLQLGIRPAHVLMRHNERFTLGMRLGDRIEHQADGGADQRLHARALHIACGTHRSCSVL